MHSQLDASEPNEPNNPNGTNDATGTPPRMDRQSWRERHALKLLGAVMAAMFATVIIAQVAC